MIEVERMTKIPKSVKNKLAPHMNRKRDTNESPHQKAKESERIKAALRHIKAQRRLLAIARGSARPDQFASMDERDGPAGW